MPRLLLVCGCLLLAMIPLGFESSKPTACVPPPPNVPDEGSDMDLPKQDVVAKAEKEATKRRKSDSVLPSLKVVNKRTKKLEFDVNKIGPSGFGSVDVYVTTDEGATWEKSTSDLSLCRHISSETREAGPQRASVTVHLPKDGMIYGFYLVAKSPGGLGKPGPKEGDAPQIRIEVDTTQPVAVLYQPQPDRDHPNSLILTWKAEARNLATKPVSLEWSESGKDWNSIGDTLLPNTGRFTWQVPTNIPPKVHLRLTVRDTAGNVGVAQTSEPVLIDLTEPEITGVQVGD